MLSCGIKILFHLVILLPIGITGFSQQRTGNIKGKIIDQSTKEPISNVSVGLLSDNQSISMTDSAGIFLIKNIPEGIYSIQISGIGFQPKKITEIIVVGNKTCYFQTELLENADTLQEVLVKTYKNEYNPMAPVSSYSFSREEIFRIPGSQGDIFRAIGILPGVSSSGGQFSAIAVRGQGTNNNVYMVDDIPLFEVSHLEGNGAFNDPNGGRFSIFAPRVIDYAQFQGGGFAAQYGRKSASLLGLGIKEGNNESPSLSGQFDLLGFTLIYDGPSYLSKKTSVFATARYQNFFLLEKVVGLKGIGLPSYGDYMIKTTTQINPKNKLSVLAMYNPEQFVKTVDDIKQVQQVQSTDLVNETNDKMLFGINLQTLTGRKSYWKNILYYRTLNSNAEVGRATPMVNTAGELVNKDSIPYESDLQNSKNIQHEIGYRSVFFQNFKNTVLTTGVDLARVDLDYSRNLKHTDTIYSYGPNDYRPYPDQHFLILEPYQFNAVFNNAAYNFSGYADFSFKPLKRLRLNTGIRFDHTGFTTQNTFSPRISGSFLLNEKSSINFATGIYYQDPEYDDIGDQPPGHQLKEERTIQYILGYKKYYSSDLKFIAETWFKQFSDQVTRPQSDQPYLTNNGTGYAYGLDLSMTKRLSDKYYGQVSFSYMVSKRDNHDGLGLYNYDFSQPYIFSLLASYKPDNKWVFSTKFRYATGRPKNNYIIHSDVFNSVTFVRSSQEIIGHNGDRLNDFISLDFRVDYHIQLRKISVTAFLDIVDVLNRYNQSGEMFQPITGSTFYDGLGIFPTFGLIIGF